MLIVYKFKRELPIGLIIQFLLERLEQVLDAVPRIRMTSNTGLPILRSCSMIAMRQYVMMAICICIRTAFSDSPQNRLTWRCCLIHLKNLCVASHKFFYDKFIVMQSKVRSIPDNQMFVILLLTSTSHNNSQCPRSLSQSRRSLLFSHSLSESRLGRRSAYAFSSASRLALESALA